MTEKLDATQIQKAAQILLDATQNARPIEKLSAEFPGLGLAEAYLVQRAGMKMRETTGAKQVGWKMGLTSLAKRQQMNLDAAIFGYLHDVGRVERAISVAGLIHPKVEPEIGFRVKKALRGAISFSEALEAIGGVCAALEIIDSRYRGFKYFSLPDVVADNCSAGQYVWGEEVADFGALEIERLQMQMYVDGVLVQEAASSEISGHPVHSLMQLSEMLGTIGEEIRPGQIVLAGAATPAVPLEPGQRIELAIDGLPRLAVDVVK